MYRYWGSCLRESLAGQLEAMMEVLSRSRQNQQVYRDKNHRGGVIMKGVVSTCLCLQSLKAEIRAVVGWDETILRLHMLMQWALLLHRRIGPNRYHSLDVEYW